MTEPIDYRIEYLADYPAYAEEVGRLKYEQWLHTSPDRPYDLWIDEIRESARKFTFPMTLLALHQQQLVGFVMLVEADENAGIEDGLWLITLFVKAPYRRQGIAAALMERCKEEARRMGHGALYLWTESPTLTAYYRQRGWRLIGQDAEGEDVMMCDLPPATPEIGNVLVRPVRKIDAGDLCANCFSMNSVDEVETRIAAAIEMQEAQTGVQLVASVDDVVVGTLTLVRNSHSLHAHRADLCSIVVHPDYQRQGIARRMVEESRTYVRDWGIDILETSCRAGTGAEAAYARMGFVEYGRLPRGIVEPLDRPVAYDQVFYYLPLR